MQGDSLEVYFATSNKHKVEEAKKVLGTVGITVKHFPFVHREIRSDSLEEIAREAATAAFKQCRQPVFVEDTGLFIDSLNGFPGTFSAWTLKKIGLEGILKLMQGVNNRSAYFETYIAYKRDTSHISTFSGKCSGQISLEGRGSEGFGYDPLFVPDGHDQTFAESITLKNKLSHRYKSLLEFSKTLTSRR
ncbi:Non-canonical purine NTP pyrophosphatase [Candidatus Bilamarchaeum dharawalense]|uniref:dITP/XTP pyrophosphatase n=1 Tax=Candidatus Bilamarchaeum dharawalense TaxID=2885759 RepID=A0A5E4LYD0_9ARCH|nr:Non-canonical purine NTP pyrophosphatase [Candidatus Bilamarchaeum dharawalense]